MKRTLFQRAVCLILSVTVILGTFAITSSAGEHKGSESTSSTLEEMKALIGTDSYSVYFASAFNGLDMDKQGALDNDVIVPITPTEDDLKDGNFCLTGDIDQLKNSVHKDKYEEYWSNFTEEDYNTTIYLTAINSNNKASTATFTFEILGDEVGFYDLYIEYYNCKTEESSVSAIQRKLLIDGKVPFSEVSSIVFNKTWTYKSEIGLGANDDRYYTKSEQTISESQYNAVSSSNRYSIDYKLESGCYKKIVTEYVKVEKTGEATVYKKIVHTYLIGEDVIGNSMAPLAQESSEWGTYICSDKSGYSTGAFHFYLSQGPHTITLEAEREPMVIKSITFKPVAVSALQDSATSNKAPEQVDGKYYFSESNSFSQYKDALGANYNDKANGGKIIDIQAEFPDAISDSSVAPSNDNTSAINYPISADSQKFNIIGETGYDAIGQWAAYKFKVTETGMYKISMRFMQEALQGMFICRSIKLAGGNNYVYGLSDGSASAPYAEATKVRFNYAGEWQSEYVGYYDADGNKHDLELYLEEGAEYTIYLECALGDLKDYIQSVEKSLANLNDAYLKILQYTGSDPDANQNYKFQEKLPEVLIALLSEAKNLTETSKALEKLCGEKGSHIATLDTVARILYTMGKDNGREIAANLSSLKTYLGTLGTWINSSKMGTMKLDSITVVPAEKAGDSKSIPAANANFIQSIWFEICSFIYSFFTRYELMGIKGDSAAGVDTSASIDVWIAMGRDQSNIWRSLIDSEGGFTSMYKTPVALKLVTGGTLLPSILSGKGPDVYLGLGAADVINYAIRDAVLGVSGNDPHLSAEANAVFADFETAVKGEDLESSDDDNFAAAAMKTLTIYSPDNAKGATGGLSNYPDNPDVTYGIPMTMGFSMMFYRMDVLAQLNQEVPETWSDLLKILPVFQANNMDIGVTYISALDFMMYQMGGNMWKYTDDTIYESKYAGAKIDLDSEIALEAFEFVCRLYTDYSFPVSFDTANRFRTGEMPIVIGDYASIYNTLVVYATDISGLWEFSSLPGSFEKNVYKDNKGNVYYKSELLTAAQMQVEGLSLVKEGKYNYNSLASVSATIILKGSEKNLKTLEASWNFVKWQTSDRVQAEYGNRIVALIGPAAKYESANLKAIDNLSWTANEKAAIKNQMAHLDAIVNYPGSYIYSRYMKFAFLDAYNDDANPHDAMMSYIDAINDEIKRKREEFGLEVLDKLEEPDTLLKDSK